MAFHYVTTCFISVIITRTEYSFLSKQSVLSAPMRPRFLSLNRLPELVWDSQSCEAGATAAMRTREVLITSQGCHICNQTYQHPEVTHPGVSFRPLPLMKRKFFSEPGQKFQTPSTSQWTRPSDPQRSVVHAFRGDTRGQKGNEAPHI